MADEIVKKKRGRKKSNLRVKTKMVRVITGVKFLDERPAREFVKQAELLKQIKTANKEAKAEIKLLQKEETDTHKTLEATPTAEAVTGEKEATPASPTPEV